MKSAQELLLQITRLPQTHMCLILEKTGKDVSDKWLSRRGMLPKVKEVF